MRSMNRHANTGRGAKSSLCPRVFCASEWPRGKRILLAPRSVLQSPFGSPAERWQRPEGSGRRAAGRGRAGDLDLQGAHRGLVASLAVDKMAPHVTVISRVERNNGRTRLYLPIGFPHLSSATCLLNSTNSACCRRKVST